MSANEPLTLRRLKIDVQGIVQGVGFRPFVYRLALRHGLAGSVGNSEAGVAIEIEGPSAAVDAFLYTLRVDAPPLARILDLNSVELIPIQLQGFTIGESTHNARASALLSPDIATCEDCLRELSDPTDRRYRYPFLNCTNCGPRFTIIRSVPYDRSQTSMAVFTMCLQCQTEYDDPLNRRFHAQPNACSACGPKVQLLNSQGICVSGDAVVEAKRLLRCGFILAVKGLGGFHLAVDAHNEPAVDRLRLRKGRGRKPFAIMVKDVEAARRLCDFSTLEADLLMSPERPIVLLRRQSSALNSLAPDTDQLGIFLPYTPLHHLLLEDSGLAALVMTSGNLSEEPIAIDNQEAMDHLGCIADYFLMHDREILLRCDDSVVRCVEGKTLFVRRSRGFVPTPIVLREEAPCVVAAGGELKNTICISRGRYAFPGQHIGDMENLSAYDFFQESITHFETILEVHPKIIAHDLHPGYLATQWAKRQAAARQDVRLVGVQHHHAHIASCMAEHQLTGKVVGVALDGTGYGIDGNVWGGEVFIADLQDFTRAAHLAYTPMPGGEKCIHEPWRMAIAYLWNALGDTWKEHLPPAVFPGIPETDIRFVEQMLRRNINAPLTSSCGRLFDAVAALVCGTTHASYEAQAAIIFEACCSTDADAGIYPFSLGDDDPIEIGSGPLFAALAKDLRDKVAPSIMSRRFHAGLVDAFTTVVVRVAERSGIMRICLSGGCLQNVVLARGLQMKLEAAGLQVYAHTQVPPGDGGLSLGQLAVAAHRLRNEVHSTRAEPERSSLTAGSKGITD